MTKQWLPDEIDRRLVALYRAWDILERRLYDNTIIDFDLAPSRHPLPLTGRKEVLQQLRSLADELRGDKSAVVDLIQARITASTTYLRALLGETVDFRPYIEQTLGISPRFFSEREIEMRKCEVRGLLHDDYGLQYWKRGLGKFQNKFLLSNTTLPGQFELYRKKWIPKLLDHISVPVKNYIVRVEFAEEDAYWKNWISGNLANHEILLRINIHPRHIWYQGFAEPLVIHEYCGHAIQVINWHRRIESRELPQFLGILTVHFPDQFLLEGLAESLVYFLPERQELEQASLVAREIHRHYLMVMNNMHIIANEQGNEEAFQYAESRLPFTAPDTLKREIRDRTKNSLFRCYQYVYGIAKESFLTAFSSLTREQGWTLLRLAYDWPMTAKQFETAVRQIGAQISVTAPTMKGPYSGV